MSETPSQQGKRLWLASASPRRVELLRQLGVAYRQRVAEIDETPNLGEIPIDYVQRMARGKAQALWQLLEHEGLGGNECWVLGADTTVHRHGHIFGKPLDERDAIRMLRALSGGTHQVLSAIALVSHNKSQLRVSVSEVRFKSLAPTEIEAYWRTGEPRGKAGAYAILGLGADFIEHLSGSYSGVMGLPLFETAEVLQAAGIAVWQESQP
jgi:septum formation protein